MTYLELGTAKLFTDNDVQCGEFDPRQCRCGASTQNSYEYLMDEFGPRVPVAPVVDIVQPRDGAWVLPGFPIYVNVESFPVPSTTIEVDGLPATLGGDREIVANAPVELPSGEVQVVVTSTNDHPRRRHRHDLGERRRSVRGRRRAVRRRHRVPGWPLRARPGRDRWPGRHVRRTGRLPVRHLRRGWRGDALHDELR
jgi:hypothetical protein